MVDERSEMNGQERQREEQEESKMKIKVISPFLSYSGYGRAARAILRQWARDERLDVYAVASEPPQFPCPEELGKMFVRRNWTKEDQYLNLIFTIPPQFYGFYDTKAIKNIGYCTFEGTQINKDWVNACNSMDEVWVHTCDNYDTFERSGVVKPLKVFPLGCEPEMSKTSFPLTKSEKYTFLHVGDFNACKRKGLDVAIIGYLNIFKPEDPVRLLLKTNSKGECVTLVRGILESMGLKEWPEIRVLYQDFPDSKLSSIYASADCLLAPFMAEGHCLPVMEALASGLRVICTRYGGPTEYAEEWPESVVWLDGAFVPAQGGNHYSDAYWIEPDVQQFENALVQCFEEGKRDKKHYARLPLEWSWDNQAKNLADSLIESWERENQSCIQVREEQPTDFFLVAYKSPDLLHQTLQTLQASLSFPERHRLYVYNNDPEDFAIRNILDACKIPSDCVHGNENIGFSCAVNNLLSWRDYNSARKTDWVCLINPDLEFRNKCWLADLQHKFRTERELVKIGAISPMLIYPDTGQVQFAGGWVSPKYEWGNAYGLSGHMGWRDNPYAYKSPRYCDYLTFACCLLSAEALQEVGLLDEDFFIGNEDVMYGKRMNMAGYLMLCDPSVRVWHHECGCTSPEDKTKRDAGWKNKHLVSEAAAIREGESEDEPSCDCPDGDCRCEQKRFIDVEDGAVV